MNRACIVLGMSVYDNFISKYKKFTLIQEKAMPIIAEGSNCLVIAPTGSGKTEAAVLPIIDMASKIKGSGIKVLYITPLRALNRDMLGRLRWLADLAGLTIGVRHGDTTNSERSKQVRSAPDILVTTPESLQSMLPTKGMGIKLANVKFVIIDEIHEFYFNKRGAQLSIGLERLEEKAPNFQRVGLSATVKDPDLVKRYLAGSRECKVAQISDGRDFLISIKMPEKPKHNMSQMVDKFGLDEPSAARLECMADEIKESASTLIFANTRQIVEALGSKLLYLDKIDPFGGIGVHHGSLDKDERIEIEDRFRENKIKSIIATSSLELGIDIGSINKVIQYGSPRQSLRLAQRVGRSGHSILKTPEGTIISTGIIDTLESMAVIDNLKAKDLESFDVQKNALDVLANQICGIVLDKNSCSIDDIYSIVRRSYNYSNLEKSALINNLKFMDSIKLIGFDGKTVVATSRTRMYYYDHLSVIPDSHRYRVRNVANNKIISSLDEEFVSNNIDENSIFITKGLPWRVISIDKDTIVVEPSTNLDAAIPDWSGEDIPVSYSVSSRMRDIIGKNSLSNYIDKTVYEKVERFLKNQSDHWMPSKKKLVVEIYDNYTILYTWLGSLANDALSRLIAKYLTMNAGHSINIKSSPYLIFFDVSDEIAIKSMLLGINPESVYQKLKESIIETDFFKYKFTRVAKIFGIIDRDAILSKSLTKHIISTLIGSPVYEETLREIIENYFDIKNLTDFFKQIHERNLELIIEKNKKQSPLTKAILKSAYYNKELIMPLMPNDELVNSFSKYTLDKKANIICTYCGFEFKRNLSEIIDEPKILCPMCQSPMVTINMGSYINVIKKIKEKRELTETDKRVRREMMANADLVYSYGGRAVAALSTYGVGHRTAARALLMQRTSKEKFFVDLIEAQKQFIKNKKYWSL